MPSLNKKLVVELARCEWIGRRENVLALGNSGTGKTHIGLALGLAACQRGFSVRFTTAAALVHELIEAPRRETPAAVPEAHHSAGAADRGRARLRATVEDRRRDAV
jgi:DNA replication protein DnaC